MKKLVTFLLAFSMVIALCTTVFAELALPPYSSSDYDTGPAQNNGHLMAVKESIISQGKAGDTEDDTRWYIEGVRGDAVPTIDGQVTEQEGYEDFLNYEDYLYVGASPASGSTEWYAWYEEVKNMDFVVKTCWDGRYLYMFMEYTIKDYTFTVSSGALMFQSHCAHVGVANYNATSGNRSETGYGVNNKNESLTGTWGGNYSPIANEDYVGKLSNVEGDPTTKKISHEYRIDLMEALNRTENILAGEKIRLSWLIDANNLPTQGRFISFSRGLFDADGKHAEKFAVIQLVGDVDYNGETTEKYYTPTEEDIENEFHKTASIFFYDIQNTNDFKSNDGITATYSDDKTYITLTTESAKSLYYSESRYPLALWANQAGYAVVKYRTTSEGMQLGLNFKNTAMNIEAGENEVVFVDEYAIYPTEESAIVADGEWHYAILNTSASGAWRDIISCIGIETTTGSIDIESVRFYGYDPAEQYGYIKDVTCVCADWCEDCTEDVDTCLCQGTCECPGHVDANSDNNCDICNDDMPNETVTTPCTEHVDADKNGKCDKCDADMANGSEEPKKEGCKSVVATSAAFVLVAAVATGALLFKKKKD